jgi:flagellar hook-basal body complex protein FliE
MSGIEAVGAIGGEGVAPLALRLGEASSAMPAPAGQASFGEVLMAGLRNVDGKVANADALVQRFAVDDNVPVHQVTMALAEARLSVDLAMQVRARLLDGYRELMNMPL